MGKPVAIVPTPAEAKLVADFTAGPFALQGGGAVSTLRAEAFEMFRAAGLPTRRVEAWHYTDLRQAMREALPLSASMAPGAIAAQAARLEELAPRLAGVETIRLVLVDGYYVAALSDVARLPKGLTVQSLGDVLRAGDASIVSSLAAAGLGGGDATLALNTAFMQGGLVIDVADGVTIADPVEIISLSSGEAAQSIYARSLVRLGKGAKLTLVEDESGDEGALAQRNVAMVFQIGNDAVLEHVFAPASLASGSVHVAHLLATIGTRASFNSFTLARGGGLFRRQVHMRFDGDHARGQLAGATLLRGRDHSDTTLVVEHVAPHCESREYFKTVLDGEATGVYQGKVMVAPGAQKTDGSMKSQAILLSDGASMNNKPELEIFADDVVCGHGATVAQLDEDQVFYAMARGLPKAQAESLLLEAFIDEATDRVENEDLRTMLAERIGLWLAARKG
ncbi:MAG: Fe-S cluster assembly protein SufD [Pseudomonadota bacterium]